VTSTVFRQAEPPHL